MSLKEDLCKLLNLDPETVAKMRITIGQDIESTAEVRFVQPTSQGVDVASGVYRIVPLEEPI